MLRVVVANFLTSLNEREFDAPLLAILAGQGFYDIHFIHGGFEFGKDVIAKKADPETGEVRQYSIQSKAGDINLGAWREVRPQVEECEYNTRSHPSFDETLSRVAVLATTGRLKGAAGVDAQEFRRNCQSRGLADFEVWDQQTILDWLCADPSLGLTPNNVQDELIALVSKVRNGSVTEPELERFSRLWLVDDPTALRRASIESSILCNLLRDAKRLDLAAYMSLHLFRAGSASASEGVGFRSPVAAASVRLFVSYTTEILNQVDDLLDDPIKLALSLVTPNAIVTYPVACCRLVELLGLLALVGDNDLSERASAAVARLGAEHPGSARPAADWFAVSLIPSTVVMARRDRALAASYLRSVSKWLLDRYDADHNGLGLASLDEDEETAVERLLGGALEGTQIERRRPSYVATVLLDLLILLDCEELYEAVRQNLDALQIVPIISAADEQIACWRRGGADVFPHPRVDYGPWVQMKPSHHSRPLPIPAVDAVLLSTVCRSRHTPEAIRILVCE